MFISIKLFLYIFLLWEVINEGVGVIEKENRKCIYLWIIFNYKRELYRVICDVKDECSGIIFLVKLIKWKDKIVWFYVYMDFKCIYFIGVECRV